MVRYFKLGVLSGALMLAWTAHAADATTDAVKPPIAEKALASVSAPAVEQPKEKATGSGKFIERAGTGGSKAVRTAAPVALPEGPLGKAPPDISKLIGEAQAAGGERPDVYQKEINLPGLKRDDPSLKPFVLHTRNGVNEIVKMSARLMNRVATPFKKPLIIDTTESAQKIVGSDIYYTPAGDKPIGVFIVDSENSSQTISLTIVPVQDIPGQNLIIKLEDLRTVGTLAVASSEDEAEVQQPRASDYSGYVRSLMTQAVRGKIQGFSPIPLEGGVALMGTLEVEPEVAFAGSVVDIYRYKLLNKGTTTIDLVETAFSRKGVKAVSFFPKLSLQPGEGSYVFLMADKPKSASGSEQVTK